MEHVDPLVSAVREVSAVAAELREVKKRAEQYGQATERLQEVSGALGQLSGAVAAMQVQFQHLLTSAETVVLQIEQARKTSEVMVESVPSIVARIESTDVAANTRELSRSFDSVNSRIAEQLTALQQMQMLLSTEREAQLRMFSDIAARAERTGTCFERMGTDLAEKLAQIHESVQQVHDQAQTPPATLSAIGTSADKAVSAATVYGDKTLKQLTALNSKLEAMQKTLEQQGETLTGIKSKKGFQF